MKYMLPILTLCSFLLLPHIATGQVINEGFGLDSIALVGITKRELKRTFGKQYNSLIEKVEYCEYCDSSEYRSTTTTRDKRFMDYPQIGITAFLSKKCRVETLTFYDKRYTTSHGVAVGDSLNSVISKYTNLFHQYNYIGGQQYGIKFWLDDGVVTSITIFPAKPTLPGAPLAIPLE